MTWATSEGRLLADFQTSSPIPAKKCPTPPMKLPMLCIMLENQPCEGAMPAALDTVERACPRIVSNSSSR